MCHNIHYLHPIEPTLLRRQKTDILQDDRSGVRFYIWFQVALRSSERHNPPPICGSPTTKVHNPDKFPRVRRSVGQPVLVDRSARGDRGWSIDRSATPSARTWRSRGDRSLAHSSLLIFDNATETDCHLSCDSLISYISLRYASRWKSRILCYPRTPLPRTAMLTCEPTTSPRTSFKFPCVRFHGTGFSTPAMHPRIFLRNSRDIDCNGGRYDIELKCDRPCYMFILSSVTMEYVTRAMQPCGSIICIRLFWEGSRFSPQGLKCDRISRLYLVKYIHILLYILYTAALVGYLLFSFPRREISRYQKFFYHLPLTVADLVKLNLHF